MVTQVNTMAPRTRTLNLRITEGQYEAIEAIVESGQYTSKSEFVRELIRNSTDDFTVWLRQKARNEKELYVSLEEFGKEQGFE